jgi:hypothetical protein
MRLVFGTGRVQRLADGTFGLAFKRLHQPLTLLPNGATPVPDISAYDGQLLLFQGLLETCPAGNDSNRNLAEPRAHFTLLRVPGSADTAVAKEESELTAIVAGNTNKDPEMNPRGDRVSVAIPYHSGPRDSDSPTAWVNVCAEFAKSEGPDALAQMLLQQKKGTRLLCAGVLTSYEYNNESRVHVQLKGFDLLGNGAVKGKTLGSAYAPESETALSDEEAF